MLSSSIYRSSKTLSPQVSLRPINAFPFYVASSYGSTPSQGSFKRTPQGNHPKRSTAELLSGLLPHRGINSAALGNYRCYRTARSTPMWVTCSATSSRDFRAAHRVLTTVITAPGLRPHQRSSSPSSVVEAHLAPAQTGTYHHTRKTPPRKSFQAMASRGRCGAQAWDDEQRREERGEKQAPAPQGPTVLHPPPLVDYGVFMQGLV
ncbi:hypothetical protein Taro_013423 [Colocasia esculenta]|uniref:Uncharacterized protein n=1 Tax=Colocasia esculenta TaxID=4460 RepID=A0A843UBU2_COLES|nr:hypothetical protein [Colocasia esculenta]